MESPSISLMEDLNPAISFAINGEVTLSKLKKTAEEIEDDLKGMDGISKIRISVAIIVISFPSSKQIAFPISKF